MRERRTGKRSLPARGPRPQGVEVLAERVEVLAAAEPPPFEVFHPEAASKNRLDTLLDHRAICLRVPAVLDVFRVQAVVLEAFREFLRGESFTEIATPKLVLAGAEGGSAVFRVEYYDARRIWRRARSSTSRSWWEADWSGSSRWATPTARRSRRRAGT